MLRVRRRRRAGLDLEEIWWRIAPSDPAAADRLVRRIVAAYQNLGDHPRLGPERSDIAPGLRILVVDDYVILYEITATHLDVVRVVHGSRNLRALIARP